MTKPKKYIPTEVKFIKNIYNATNLLDFVDVRLIDDANIDQAISCLTQINNKLAVEFNSRNFGYRRTNCGFKKDSE